MRAMASTDQVTGTDMADRSAEVGYTLDQLEELSGVPARTIRFYRQSGLIDPPRRLGRQAFYAPDQLARLRFIAALRNRGMGLEAVAKFLADPHGEQESLSVLLALQDKLLEPWIEDHAAVVEGPEITRLMGDRNINVLADLEHFGLVKRESPESDTYEVSSMVLLELAAAMDAIGIDPEIAAEAWAAMQRWIARLADDLVTIFGEDPAYGMAAADDSIDAVSAAFDRLKPVAMRAVQVAFAQEIHRAVGEFFTFADAVESVTPEAPPAPSAPSA